jgi:hypothetical protein
MIVILTVSVSQEKPRIPLEAPQKKGRAIKLDPVLLRRMRFPPYAQ